MWWRLKAALSSLKGDDRHTQLKGELVELLQLSHQRDDGVPGPLLHPLVTGLLDSLSARVHVL